MEQNKDDAASPASHRILDRKIESKALPSGFSSNLGRKAPSGDKGGAVKSVKAIVDWLEKTSTAGPENPEVKTPQGRDKAQSAECYSLSSKAGKSSMFEATTPEPAATGSVFPQDTPPTHPEEYSLTLLKYKSYFNNRPLARCLDGQEEKPTTPAAKSTPKAVSSSSCYSIQKLDNIMATLEEMQSGFAPDSPTPNRRIRAKSVARPEERASEAPFLRRSEAESCANDVAEVQGVVEAAVVRRDPAAVKAF
jgi:hypothetical protein